MSELGKEVVAALSGEMLVQRFEKTAPAFMHHEAEMGFAVQHLRANDYLLKVAKQDPSALMAAMSNVAACGLSLNPAEKTAYLVPRKGKICFDPSYMGLMRLATNTGSIEWVQAYCVHEGDNFQLRGAGEKPLYESDPFASKGEFRGAFCVAKTKGGDYLTTAMSAAEINEVRDNSEAFKKGGGPWKSHYNEMAKKTVIRRAFKTWPLSDENENDRRMAEAVHISNENEGMELAKTAPDLGQYSDAAKEYFDQLLETEDWVGLTIFKESKSETEWNNLYHSFEKGQKGKYQKIVDGLYSKGQQAIRDYVDLVNEAVARNDVDCITDYIADMGDLKELVMDRVSNEAAMAMRSAA